ncbi:MAG: ATP-dependent DNA helicase RecG [Actinomycetota bacterium]|nr:ATP-dependent DNA helicase RecG [Actinomycetota bacterium]
MPFLAQPLTKVLGLRSAQPLEKHLGLKTVDDLLRHYPRRYIERGELTPLKDLREGEQVTVLARVKKVQAIPMRGGKGKVVKAVITDGSDELDASFFAPKPWLAEKFVRELRPGAQMLFAGTVGSFRGHRQLTHPEIEAFDGGDGDDPTGSAPDGALERAEQFAEEIRPIYPAAAKVATWKIAKMVRVLLDNPEIKSLEDPVPQWIRERRDLIPLDVALRAIHRPGSQQEIETARQKLTYDEAFVLQVALAGRRAEVAAQPAIPRAGQDEGLLAAFDARLPFALTKGQVEVSQAITADLANDHPMHRLLQGEVGSGKTIVALRAMLTVVDAGGQAALLAPTEVLAQQHHRSITALMGDLAEGGMLGGHASGTQVRLLTGSQSAGARTEALEDARSGSAGIVIGTHALLQDRVEFHDLGLVVVDEQHRFGVEQRDALRAKADRPPHLLVMTATPIPRTVAMTVFGDLTTSTLRELPAGRQPIATHVVPGGDRRWVERSWERVREEVDKGHQVYVVCPRIGGEFASEETMMLELERDADETAAASLRRPAVAALDLFDDLRANPVLAGTRIEVLHGRLPADEKDAVMSDFAAGRIDVLVATTVVEVGVDVANATTMVVQDAERFGVSQLHQLRGRVGRGSAPGLCLLVSEADPAAPGWQRLEAVASTLDGFELAAVDLEQRREGNVLGASQSGGRSSLRFLKVMRDEGLIALAREDAAELIDADPVLVSQPALVDALFAQLNHEQIDFLERG